MSNVVERIPTPPRLEAEGSGPSGFGSSSHQVLTPSPEPRAPSRVGIETSSRVGSAAKVARWMCMMLMAVVGAMGVRPASSVEAHSEEATISVKTYTPIVVDGTLDDWVRRLEGSNWTGQLEVQKGQVREWIRAVPAYVNTLTSKVESGMVKNPEDLSATIYTMWDAERFYLAAVVQDDEVVTQHEGGDIWQDDAVELWLDCRHDAVTHTLAQDDEYQLGFSPASQYRSQAIAWAWRNPHAEQVIPKMQVASSSMPHGYIVEAAVPWSALQGCQPAIGGMIGFNISLVDKDEDQSWTHLTWSGQLHSDPSQFGHLYFVDAPVDLFPSDVFDGSSGPSPLKAVLESSDAASQNSNGGGRAP